MPEAFSCGVCDSIALPHLVSNRFTIPDVLPIQKAPCRKNRRLALWADNHVFRLRTDVLFFGERIFMQRMYALSSKENRKFCPFLAIVARQIGLPRTDCRETTSVHRPFFSGVAVVS
jgi:hypothetical protein